MLRVVTVQYYNRLSTTDDPVPVACFGAVALTLINNSVPSFCRSTSTQMMLHQLLLCSNMISSEVFVCIQVCLTLHETELNLNKYYKNLLTAFRLTKTS